jgi:hypothetical protein
VPALTRSSFTPVNAEVKAGALWVLASGSRNVEDAAPHPFAADELGEGEAATNNFVASPMGQT